MTAAAVIDALVDAEELGISVVNMSFHFPGSTSTGLQSVKTAIDNFNGLVVAAAGNDGNNGVEYPAGFSLECDNMIVVASSNRADEISTWSNYSREYVHLTAPGEDIFSTEGNGGHSLQSGTSMAAAHVSGAAALLKAYRPDYITAQMKEAVLNSVDVIPGLENYVSTGGRLNLNSMLKYRVVDFVPGEVLVGMEESWAISSTPSSSVFPGVEIAGIRNISENDSDAKRQLLLLSLTEETKQGVLDAINLLRENPNVEYAEPNCIGTINAVSDDPFPNDFFFDRQWGMMRIEAPDTWGIDIGNKRVRVGVLDTGIHGEFSFGDFIPHEDLADNMENELMKSFILNDTVKDWDGHGTHVAGIIGAVGNNEIGVAGVNWTYATLVPMKVIGGGSSATIEALKYARNNGIPIVNMSFVYRNATTEELQALKEEIETFGNFGGLVVAGAANDRNDIDFEPLYPASYARELDNVITVANSDQGDNKSDSSSYGVETVALAAPGNPIEKKWAWFKRKLRETLQFNDSFQRCLVQLFLS